jgi:hypothetical protein
MDDVTQSKLEDLGLVFPDESGEPVVRVSLQYQTMLDSGSREDRRQRLEQYFSDVAARTPVDVKLDPGSLRVSGQAVDALVPARDLEALQAELGRQDIRVDPVVVRKLN